MVAALPVADPLRQLQSYLKDTGRYHGFIDGDFGPLTKQSILSAMEDGPDTPLSEQSYRASAARLGIKPAYIMAFAEVEANGAGFERGVPKILFEPHRFSKLTRHAYDASNPKVSYATWNPRGYPKRIDDRYTQLLEAVSLDPWAGFCAASYGKFQILGENFKACGYDTPWNDRESLAAAALLAAPVAASAPASPQLEQPAVPLVICPMIGGYSAGSAFRIGPHLLLSVNHVTSASATCGIDGQRITVIYASPERDFSVLSDDRPGSYLKPIAAAMSRGADTSRSVMRAGCPSLRPSA
jgi:hypothetical protein